MAHVPGAEATEETPQLCTVCQYEIAPSKAHEHKYESDWLADSDGHWKDCKCGEHSLKDAHTFDGGKVLKEPTKDEIGEKHYTCADCGYVKKVELELVGDTMFPSTDNETPNDSAEESDDSFSIISMLIGIAIGAVAGVGVMLVVGKKKR